VAASHHNATLNNAASSYTTSVDSTLDHAGMFAVRGSIDLTASALSVSRTTVYALLKEIRP